PYLVRKSSELFCLDIRIELDVQGALSVSIAPPFTGGAVLLAGWRAKHGTQLRLALAGKGERVPARSRRACRRVVRNRSRAGHGGIGGSRCGGCGARPRGRGHALGGR